MDDKNQSKTVHNDGITLPQHDFDGLSKVIAESKPTLPGTENGFIPLNDFDLAKPYEEVAKYLEKWEKRLSEDSLQPDQIIAELKEAKQKLVDKHENDFEQRINDITSGYKDRIGEWKDHHRVMVELFTQWIEEWKNRIHPIEMKKEALEEELKKALIDYCDTRLSELKKFHDEIKDELNTQIFDLKSREQKLSDKIADLEQERRIWMDERRDWLLNREEKLDNDKQQERDAFKDLRKRVVENEHPLKDEVEKTAAQIIAENFNWHWGGLFAIALIAAIVLIIGFCLHWGNTPNVPIEYPLPQISQQLTTEATITATTTNEGQ